MNDTSSLPADLLRGAHAARDLLAAGLSRSELSGPLWQRLDQGRYRWAASEPDPIDRIRQALPLLPSGGVVGGWAAAIIHGVQGMDGDTGAGTPLPIQVSLSRHQTCRRSADARVFRSDLDPADRTEVDGVPVTSLDRTAFDIARLDLRTVSAGTTRDSLDESVAWIDAMLRDTALDLSSALAYVEARRQRSGARQARRVLHLADGRSASPQESRLRLVWMIDARLPKPLSNEALLDHAGELIAVPDLLDVSAGLVAEYDGAVHAASDRRSKDTLRAEKLSRFGLEVVRITAEDLRHRERTVQRLQSAYRRALAADRPAQYVPGGPYRIQPAMFG